MGLRCGSALECDSVLTEIGDSHAPSVGSAWPSIWQESPRWSWLVLVTHMSEG